MSSAVLVTLVSLVAAGAGAPGGMGRAADPWFPELGDNLTAITWAHAVNDKTYLQAALASDVMMLEADVVLGRLEDAAEDSPPEPVMAHPPAVTSDLSLRHLLAAVAAHNAAAPYQPARKGVKLDYKSIEAFEASADLLANITGDAMSFPVWLNADILPGPIDAGALPVDADRFLALATAHPRADLSVGWTTRLGADGDGGGEYASEHAAAMLRALSEHRVAQRVTFPVRAALAAPPAARAVLLRLLTDARALPGAPAVTLTVWDSADDPVPLADLRALVLEAGLDSVYLDLQPTTLAALALPDNLSINGPRRPLQ